MYKYFLLIPYTQIDGLATIYAELKEQKYKSAAVKRLNFLLQAQYKNGSWSQYYLLASNYSKEITINDGVFKHKLMAIKMDTCQ